MKSFTKIGFLIVIAAIIPAMFSCVDPLYNSPFIPNMDMGGGSERQLSPNGLSASHGEKRTITLSWNLDQNVSYYYIYKANSPLDTFIRCAETKEGQFKFINVAPGSTVYYRISAVSHSGVESQMSGYVVGTSLAQPIISDITEVTESNATVTWYMENATDNTYKGNLLYLVYCFNGAAEVAQIALDGSTLRDNKATFSNLSPNTRYEYQVEAYLRGDQHSSEKSDKFDAATARRFRPGAPVNLKATRGSKTEEVELSFNLPDMVDIALGDNQYDPKPIRFVISKRQYSASGNNEYQTVCAYFGSIAASAAAVERGKYFDGYVPGASVTWTDPDVRRGVEYEYQVQAYVDDTPKITTSDASKTSARGWALSEGTLRIENPIYKYSETGSSYSEADLPLVFNFDPKEITYDYDLVETIEPIGDGFALDPSGIINRRSEKLTHSTILNYVAKMNLAAQTTESSPGRGVYSYKVEIKLNGEILDTVSAIGKVEVSEDTFPIIVEGFNVQDGYTDKFVIKWRNYHNRRYILYMSDTINKSIEHWDAIATFNPTLVDSDETVEDYSYEYSGSGITTNITRYFAIRPARNIDGNIKQGQVVYASAASQTMGVPIMVNNSGVDPSYSNITAVWKEAQKADAYRIKYWYSGEAAVTTDIIYKNAIQIDASNSFRYSFNPFGTDPVDVSKAGKEMQIEVEALNTGLRAIVGGDEIVTTSKDVIKHHLIGPALLNASVSKAISTTDIEISWNRVIGANGYYVFRRQFNMANTAEEGTEATVYYVPADETSSITITGKNMKLDSTNAKIDTPTVKATASYTGTHYTLKDIWMTDNDYENLYSAYAPSYKNQQNDIARGLSYRYYIVPVVNRGGEAEPLASIDFTYSKDGSGKNTNITSYTIQENGKNIRFTGAAALEHDGFTYGYGQNVIATKGTYASSGNINDGVQITWSAPPRLPADFRPRYTVYRRAHGSATWDTITTDVNAQVYTDTSLQRGITYEYVIGIRDGNSGSISDPRYSRRFIEYCGTLRDAKNRPNMLGFMLDYVKVVSVTRGERADLNAIYGEEVIWQSAGIQNPVSADYNWGIDGYAIEVMNRNLNADWHKAIDNINAGGLPNQINQSFVLTTSNTPSITITDSVGTFTRNVLFVLRDYKHFYRVKSYVQVDDERKVYGPDPDWTYQYRWGSSQAAHIAASNQMQNDYVKWGARQITQDEFIKITSLYFARGPNRAFGGYPTGSTSWTTSAKSYNTSSNPSAGATGSVNIAHSYVILDATSTRTFQFSNYKDDLNTRAGDWVTFITLNGSPQARPSTSSAVPVIYGNNQAVTVTGPWDTPDLYNGKVTFGTATTISINSYNNANLSYDGSSNRSRIRVEYPTGSTASEIYYRGQDTALPFSSNADRMNGNAWR